jgi:hypothetical protein
MTNLPTFSAEHRLPANSLPSLLAELKPAGADAIKPLLAKLSLACRSGQADDIDRRAQAALYVEQLSDLPFKYLALAVDEWIKTQVFWPAISELRALTNRKAELARLKVKDLEEAQERRARAERDKNMKRVSPEQLRALRESIVRVVK